MVKVSKSIKQDTVDRCDIKLIVNKDCYGLCCNWSTIYKVYIGKQYLDSFIIQYVLNPTESTRTNVTKYIGFVYADFETNIKELLSMLDLWSGYDNVMLDYIKFADIFNISLESELLILDKGVNINEN